MLNSIPLSIDGKPQAIGFGIQQVVIVLFVKQNWIILVQIVI